jgi:hypothetical protein
VDAQWWEVNVAGLVLRIALVDRLYSYTLNIVVVDKKEFLWISNVVMY